jgi:glycosyltransferase involved in cell wall biosynthesis
MNTQSSVLSPHSSLHIGFLTADLTHNHGWAHYGLSLLLALRRAGVNVTVVTAHNSPSIDRVTVLPILPTVDPLEAGMLAKQLLAVPRVRHTLAACDLIHSTIEPYAPLAALVAGKRPFVVTGHGSYVRAPRQRSFPASAVYEWAFRRSLLVCVSHYTATQAKAAMPGVRTAVVNNGVDVERFTHLPNMQTRARRPTVLSVGAIKARKGTLALVHAMAKVREVIPDVRCMIIGSLEAEPEYTAQVQTAIETLQLNDTVHLLGRVPDDVLLGWYSAADVFALPSLNVDWKFEGYGLSLMEASAAGLPVIGTTDCGAEDAVNNGETGLLIRQTNIDRELPQAIIRLLTDTASARRMGEAGRARAQGQTWDHVAQQVIEIYESMVNREGAQTR